jgi:hypothetical protein
VDQVTRPPAAATLKLAFSASDNNFNQFSCYAEVTPELIAEITRLHTICKRWSIQEATVPWPVVPYESAFDPEELEMGGVWATEENFPPFDDDEPWRLDASYLLVQNDGTFSFLIAVKHDGDYSATGISLDTIKQVMQALVDG